METEEQIRALEMKRFRRLLRIPWTEHRTSDFVRLQVATLAGPQVPLLATVKRTKLTWLGHVIRHDTLSKTFLQGTFKGEKCRGKYGKSWAESIG